VLGKFLDRTPPEPKLLSEKPGRNLLSSTNDKDEESAAKDDSTLTAAAEEPAGPRSAFRPVGKWSDAKHARPASFNSSSEEPGKLPAAENEQPLSAARPRTAGNTVNEEGFQAEIDQMDLEISQMVAEEPTVWAFDDLRTRAETAVARAQTALERGRARLVLSKIQRFQEIKDRYEHVAQVKTESGAREAELTAAIVQKPDTPTPAAAAPQPALARFDGAGRLTAVVSLRIGTPHFAIVDPSGAVRSYVTPAPGVNLRPFLGRQVGITGARGFMPELGTPHLTARQITLLEQPLLR
jgi:hypothetical protein